MHYKTLLLIFLLFCLFERENGLKSPFVRKSAHERLNVPETKNLDRRKPLAEHVRDNPETFAWKDMTDEEDEELSAGKKRNVRNATQSMDLLEEDNKDQNQTQTTLPKIQMKIYTMSKCPDFSTLVDVLYEVLIDLKDIITVKFEFLGGYLVDDQADSAQKPRFESPRGPEEIRGDKIFLCAQKEYDNISKLMKFIGCCTSRSAEIPLNMKSCAKYTKIDFKKLKACYDKEGDKLLYNSFRETRHQKWSPTIVLDGKKFCKWHYKHKRKHCPVDDAKGFIKKICLLAFKKTQNNELIKKFPHRCQKVFAKMLTKKKRSKDKK